MAGEYQRVAIIKENRVIVRGYLKKLGFCVRNKDTIQAWYSLREYLQNVRGWKGNYWLWADERYAMPTGPYPAAELGLDEKTIKELTDQDKVADSACNFTRLENDAAQKKTRFYDFMGIATMGLVICVIIVALLAAAGKVDFGAILSGWSNLGGAK